MDTKFKIVELITFLKLMPSTERNSFESSPHLDLESDTSFNVLLSDSEYYYSIDFEVELVNYEQQVGEGDFEELEDGYNRIELITGVSLIDNDGTLIAELDLQDWSAEAILNELPELN